MLFCPGMYYSNQNFIRITQLYVYFWQSVVYMSGWCCFVQLFTINVDLLFV